MPGFYVSPGESPHPSAWRQGNADISPSSTGLGGPMTMLRIALSFLKLKVAAAQTGRGNDQF